MLAAQYNDDNSNDDSIRALCEQQANQGGYFLLNLRSCPKEQDPTWDISLGFAQICLASCRSSVAENCRGTPPSLSTLQNELRKLQWNPPSHDSSGLVRRDGGDGTFFTTWSTPLIENLSKVDRKKAERINQELQKNLCQTFQTEAAIDLACDQDRVLREHFPQTARSHREEILPPDLEEILRTETSGSRGRRGRRKPRQHDLCQNGKSGSSSDKHRNLGHPHPDRSWLVHCDMQEQDGKLDGFLKELRCPTCEARPSTAASPSRNVVHAVYVSTNALALTWLTWKSEMEPPPKR